MLSVIVFIHLIFITTWVGSQILTAVAVVPTMRRIEDGNIRVEAVAAFSRRFNHVAWGSMLIILITGGMLVTERFDQLDAIYDSTFDSRWGIIFAIKMTLWAAMIGIVALHSFVLGPRQLDLNREALQQEDGGSEPSARLRSVQRRSVMASALGLVLSLLVLGSGAFLANHNFSFLPA